MERKTFWELVSQDKKIIRIPIIQRDYAQGREDTRVGEVRKAFLNALHSAVKKDGSPLLLDFIYGEDENGTFIPFDGQQRLTTLFLLHWYAAARDKKMGEAAYGLKNFRYEVRDGARLFGEELVKFGEEMAFPLSQTFSTLIQDQSWFRPDWVYDPTIMGMLTMLDAIHKKFSDVSEVPELWNRLTDAGNPPISFLFAKISTLGTSADELFIKMNARGKQLTEFEHFKAQFIDYLSNSNNSKKFEKQFVDYLPNPADYVKKIERGLDNEWLDLFWVQFARDADEADKAAVADACFCRYLDYFCDMLNRLAWNGNGEEPSITPQSSLFERVCSALNREPLCPRGNLRFLVDTLDRLYALGGKDKSGIDNFFKELLPVGEKTASFKSMVAKGKNHFECCCTNFLSEPARLMLLGCLLAALQTERDLPAMPRRLRMLRNILEYSNFGNQADPTAQIRSVYSLVVDGRLPSVYSLVVDGKLPDKPEKSGFNARQIEEERAKEELRNEFPDNTELDTALNCLEDHPYLCGRLAVFSEKDHEEEGFCFNKETVFQGKRFFEYAFFNKDKIPYDIVVCGLLSQDDYTLSETYRRRLGSETNLGLLKDIFTTDDPEHFPRVHNAIQSLIFKTKDFHNAKNLEDMIQKIANTWMKEQESKRKMNWRYYFVRYEVMRPDYGVEVMYPDYNIKGTQGNYHSTNGFNYDNVFIQVQLSKDNKRNDYWNPFLRAAYKESECSHEKYPHVKWHNSRGAGDNNPSLQFHFGETLLALRIFERCWRIGGKDYNKELTDTQKEIIEILKKRLSVQDDIDIEDFTSNGKFWGVTLRIPGEDSQGEDTVDRIQLIVPVIQALAEMTEEESGKA